VQDILWLQSSWSIILSYIFFVYLKLKHTHTHTHTHKHTCSSWRRYEATRQRGNTHIKWYTENADNITQDKSNTTEDILSCPRNPQPVPTDDTVFFQTKSDQVKQTRNTLKRIWIKWQLTHASPFYLRVSSLFLHCHVTISLGVIFHLLQSFPSHSCTSGIDSGALESRLHKYTQICKGTSHRYYCRIHIHTHLHFLYVGVQIKSHVSKRVLFIYMLIYIHIT